jgi:hypothetical protein
MVSSHVTKSGQEPSVGSKHLIFARIVGSKLLLFASSRDLVCKLLQLGIFFAALVCRGCYLFKVTPLGYL